LFFCLGLEENAHLWDSCHHRKHMNNWVVTQHDLLYWAWKIWHQQWGLGHCTQKECFWELQQQEANKGSLFSEYCFVHSKKLVSEKTHFNLMDLKPNNKTLIDGSPQASLIINPSWLESISKSNDKPHLIGVHKQV
jgi:hypothetical protein